MFVADGLTEPRAIASMPGVVQHTRDSLRRRPRGGRPGVGGLMLYGVRATRTRTASGSAGIAEDGILTWRCAICPPTSVTHRLMADTCLDEFTDHGTVAFWTSRPGR